MHAHGGMQALPPSPAHGRAWFGTGGSHSVLVQPVVAFKIGVTEFARVFQNRALSGGKPNLMLSRMGGGGAVVWLQMGSLQKVNLCLASLHCLRQFIIGIPACLEWNRRTNLSPRKSGGCLCVVRRPHFWPQLASRCLDGMYRAESILCKTCLSGSQVGSG